MMNESDHGAMVPDVARRIHMPAEAVAALQSLADASSTGIALPDEGLGAVRELTDPQRRVTAWTTLKTMLDPDPDGWRTLYWMLYAAGAYTLPQYRRLGISDMVFDATMSCFSRFVGEHKTSYGTYGFDRDFWTYRELSARLFRLGELEFELAYDAQDVPSCAGSPRTINMHIPSNAWLEPSLCSESIAKSHAFLARFFPDWSALPYMCESWLLSPALGRLLPPSSHIIAFQSRFDILQTDEDAQDWREWVFQRSTAPIADLPERTSLQRNMKRFLLDGGKVGIGIGRLR